MMDVTVIFGVKLEWCNQVINLYEQLTTNQPHECDDDEVTHTIYGRELCHCILLIIVVLCRGRTNVNNKDQKRVKCKVQ